MTAPRDAIHPAAALGFARSAAAYERGRPGPDASVDRLVSALPNASADAVTVAQAFHWFDGPRALAEIHRVLRPAGLLALIWNRRDTRDELQQQITALLEPHRGAVPAHRDETWRVALEESPLFGPLREETFVNEQVVDAAGLADRVGSISFVAALGDDNRAALLEEVRALAGGGTVTLRYIVELQLTTADPRR